MELNDAASDNPSRQYLTRDSGSKSTHISGMQRDSVEGKPRFRLMWPKGIPFEHQLLTRVAALYERGAQKYGARNWELSCGQDDLEHHEESLERHFHKFLEGVEDGEDHAAAVVWNVNAVLLTRWNIAHKAEVDAGPSEPSIYVFPRPDPMRPGFYRNIRIPANSYDEAVHRFTSGAWDGETRRNNL